jgi:uncharacterized membrane protein
MILLAIGLILFLGVHCIWLFPDLKTGLTKRFGAVTYKIGYSLLSVIGLGLIIYGKYLSHPPNNYWVPPEWSHTAALIAVPIALILLVASGTPGHIRRLVRHPMLAGVALWSFAHLMANGEVSSLLLFGSFFIWSSFSYVVACVRTAPPPNVKGWGGDLTAIIIGFLVAMIIVRVHMMLFGIALF